MVGSLAMHLTEFTNWPVVIVPEPRDHRGPNHRPERAGSLGSRAIVIGQGTLRLGQPDGLKVATIRSVIVGVDGSDAARDALRWAIGEACCRGARLTAVLIAEPAYLYRGELPYSVDWDGTLVRARDELAHVVEEVTDDLDDDTIEQRVESGDPRRVLRDLSSGADPLIVGSRGQRRTRRPPPRLSESVPRHACRVSGDGRTAGSPPLVKPWPARTLVPRVRHLMVG